MCDGLTVRVTQGELRGCWRKAAWGADYRAFLGIPYAKPPTGALRFKPPQPAEPWSGVRDATREGSPAPQLDMMTGQYMGDEDCLFLNVYTPKLPSDGADALLPVMVMVHGGGLVHLSGSSQWWGPDFIVQHGVLMVSFNYRLGVLGFLSTGDSVVPGNMGFKDQVLALRWVQDNITAFGGDASNVTIFGVSAGGWSCHALMLSPMGKGLFRRVIAQSGVCVADGVFSPLLRERSIALAAHLGLRTQDSRQLFAFLAQQPARALVENTLQGRTDEDKARGLLFPFVGVVEVPDADGGAFMAREPADLLRSGDFQHLPLITGVCAFEGSLFTAELLKEPKLVTNMAENHRLLIPSNLRCSEEDSDTVADEIQRFYFGDKDIGKSTMKELLTLLGDLMFTYPAVRAALVHSDRAPPPVYVYLFDVFRKPKQLEGSLDEAMRFLEQFNAAGHGADMAYVFRCAFFDDVEPNSEDGGVIAKVTRLWTNFAKTGCPDGGSGAPWPEFTRETGAYLHITRGAFSVARRPFQERVAFWKRIYSRYSGQH